MKAVWNGNIIAESDDTILIEGNHYFPPESVDRSLLIDSDHSTECIWKGTANYYTLVDGEKKETNAAWYYAHPKEGSIERVKKDFTNYLAFYPNLVNITE